MKLPKEHLEKIILGVIGGIIVVVLLVAFFFAPNLRRIGQLWDRIREKREEVLRAEKEVLGLARIRLNLLKLNEKIKKYQTNMPQDRPDWLLEILNRLAGEVGVDFDKIEPKGYIIQVGSYWLEGLYIELRTSYHTLGMFINKLENTSPFIKVLDINIAGNKDDVKRHMVKLSVGAYVRKKSTPGG